MNPVTGLSVARIAVGAVALARPGLISAAFGVDEGAQPQTHYLTRMFGAREIALGAVTLAAPQAIKRPIIGMGIAVDTADSVAGLLSANQAGNKPLTTVARLVPTISAVIAGIVGLATASGPTPTEVAE